jgi:hypothetical protein
MTAERRTLVETLASRKTMIATWRLDGMQPKGQAGPILAPRSICPAPMS